MLKPFWSIMIPSYNCASLLPKAIESALACKKAFPDTQIEVVDDASPRDDPEAAVQRYREFGVDFYRQPENVGASRNFNSCIERARGQWVHILHGDDYVSADFYEKLHQGLSSDPSARVAVTPYVAVDENGARRWGNERGTPRKRGLIGDDYREAIAVANQIMAPSIVAQKSAYEEVGHFDSELIHTADWDMWKRLIWKFDTWFEPDALAYYLVHSASDTSKLMRTGANLYDSLRALKKAERYFPAERRKEFEDRARKAHAELGVQACLGYLQARDYTAAAAQLKASFVLSPGWVLGHWVRSMAKFGPSGIYARLTGKAG